MKSGSWACPRQDNARPRGRDDVGTQRIPRALILAVQTRRPRDLSDQLMLTIPDRNWACAKHPELADWEAGRRSHPRAPIEGLVVYRSWRCNAKTALAVAKIAPGKPGGKPA